MDILERKIGRLPFVIMNLLLYIMVPFYYAAWEYRSFAAYAQAPDGLVMGTFCILEDGIPFFFGREAGGLASLEFTAPFCLLLLLVTLWRCNDCQASKWWLLGQCLPLLNVLTLVILTVRRSQPVTRHFIRSRQEVFSEKSRESDCLTQHRHIA
ncbi:hypothetical protein [Mitsuokella sp.]|uniref:hypothetical protein n=1 Tax=Mitsuokella sp. TaxID=2049034 RepID=UPI003D7CC62C